MSITEHPVQLQIPSTETIRPRPRCAKCGKPGPTIDGRCGDHLELATEGRLYCVSPEDLEAAGLL